MNDRRADLAESQMLGTYFQRSMTVHDLYYFPLLLSKSARYQCNRLAHQLFEVRWPTVLYREPVSLFSYDGAHR